MEIGRLKHRIKILKVVNKRQRDGSYKKESTVVATPYCEVSKTTIKEFREQDLEARREAINFIIRYQQRVEIESGMQVEFKNKVYEIKNIETDYQDLERIMLKCEVVE